MSKKCALIFILLSLILIASIVVNVVAINMIQTRHITNCIQIGLAPLINGNILEMYVDDQNNPYVDATVNDPEIIQAAIDILDSGCYQKCGPVPNGSAPGSNMFPYIRIQVDEHTYVIEVITDRICVVIDGQKQYYRSNIQHKMQQWIWDVLYGDTSSE